MLERKVLAAPLQLKADGPEGSLVAQFSTFNVRDSQGDVVLPGAFPEGAAVPLVWSHEWSTFAVGKGTIRSDAKAALFDGAFHLETQFSRDAYATVKAMGALQEYSYGFQVGEAEQGTWDGEPARLIRRFERVYEVSPVLVGAGVGTHTVTIKQADDATVLEADAELRPFAHEHACRLHAPDRYSRFRRQNGARTHDGKPYDVIFGRRKSDGGWEDQAYRYPAPRWGEREARAHCRAHEGMAFEPATGASGLVAADPDRERYLAAIAARWGVPVGVQDG